ncbi:unnamed protein product, partial [Ixodes pacificus]
AVRPLLAVVRRGDTPLSAEIPVEIVCEAVGSRPPAAITWWRNGVQLNQTFNHVSADGNESTSVVNFTPTSTDNGLQLMCRAQNPLLPGAVAEDVWVMRIYFGRGRPKRTIFPKAEGGSGKRGNGARPRRRALLTRYLRTGGLFGDPSLGDRLQIRALRSSRSGNFGFQESLETGASPVATTWPGVREFNRRPDCAASHRSRVALTSVCLGHPSGSLFHVPSPHIVEVGLGSSFYLARPIALSEEQLRPGPHVPPRLNCRLKTSSHDR